ncbi:MAG: MerR family transcriptional regulator [Beijerinckiaceae bacterium]
MSLALLNSLSNSGSARSLELQANSHLPYQINISEMAKRHDTTLRTLRFYETKGLLQSRRNGAVRVYDETAQRRFKLIDEGRKLGFTLAEIAEMLGSSTNLDELRISTKKIEEQIRHLEATLEQTNRALGELRRRHYLMSEADEAE